jgi:hypothetical protein
MGLLMVRPRVELDSLAILNARDSLIGGGMETAIKKGTEAGRKARIVTRMELGNDVRNHNGVW